MGTIYLIRHGQASFDADDYDNLSPLGTQQAQQLGAYLAHKALSIEQVFCGGMRRHQQTANACLNAWQAPPAPQQLNSLNEYDHHEIIVRHTPRYADYQVMRDEMRQAANPTRAFQRFFSAAMQRWMDPQFASDYQEPWALFQQRCHHALNTLSQSVGEGTTLVFTSGGFIATLCQHLLGLSDHHTLAINWQLVNTGITKLLRQRDGCVLSVLNEHSHLDHQRDWVTYR